MKLRLVRTALTSAALVATGALSACGSDDSVGAEDSSTVSQENPETSATESTESTQPTESTESTESTQPTEPTDDGNGGATGGAGLTEDNFADTLVQAQAEAGSVHLAGEFGVGAQSISLTGDLRFGDAPTALAMDVTMDIASLPGGAQMIIVDETLYMNLGAATQNKFAELDLSDPSNPLTQQFGPLLESADPSSSIDALDAGLLTLTEVGTEQVDDVETTHYRATVDSDKALEASGTFSGSSGLGQLPKTFVYDVWVGNDDALMRRISFDVLGLGSQIQLTGWGESSDIAAPPAAQIIRGNPFGLPGG